MATPTFSPGDKVRCIRPLSDVRPDFDLCPDTVYTIAGHIDDGVQLENSPIRTTYIPSRFVLVRPAPGVVDTAWDNWKAIR